jgi:hypothetical protein
MLEKEIPNMPDILDSQTTQIKVDEPKRDKDYSVPYKNSRVPIPNWKRRVMLETAWGMIRDADYNIIGT